MVNKTVRSSKHLWANDGSLYIYSLKTRLTNDKINIDATSYTNADTTLSQWFVLAGSLIDFFIFFFAYLTNSCVPF